MKNIASGLNPQIKTILFSKHSIVRTYVVPKWISKNYIMNSSTSTYYTECTK